MPKVWAFDVDETLEISCGPVKIQDLVDLRNAGEIVGLCGNWGLFCARIPNWHQLISFINLGLPKAVWLRHFREVLPRYDDYILVGNIMGVSGASDDQGQAMLANWRFIQEADFAKGIR